jgi:hypothetical protein
VAHVVGADEAGPAGHEEAHGGNSWSVGKRLKTTENREPRLRPQLLSTSMSG